MISRGYSRRKLNHFKNSSSLVNRKSFRPRRNINEYFHKQSSLNWQNKVLIYFFAVVFIYLIYLFFFSHFFRIDNVIVEGNSRINKVDIEILANKALSSRKLLLFKNNNYFLFDSSYIKKELTKNNVLDELIIKRRHCSTLFIYIKEKDVKAVYQIGNDYLLIDKLGNIISKVDQNDSEVKKQDKILIRELPKIIIENQADIDNQNKNIVKDNSLYQSTSSTIFVSELVDNKIQIKEVSRIMPVQKEIYSDIKLGENIIKKENIERISYINDSLNTKFNNIRPVEYQYEQDKSDIVIVLLNIGPKVYFKLDENLESQVSNLYKYVIEQKNDLKGLNYIDLRQKDQIIIK